MRLDVTVRGSPVWHDCRVGFGEMLRLALSGSGVVAASGPIYTVDPAGSLLEPFGRSARETGWTIEEDQGLAPQWVLERARSIRSQSVCDAEGLDELHDDLVDWARAGLVLEVSRRRGICVMGRGFLHPNWKLNGTITGRFGCEPVRGQDSEGKAWVFNPLSLGEDDRWRIRPCDYVREVAVLDFRGMDVCSMLSIVPGLREVYAGHSDPHQRTADLTGLTRSEAKVGLLSWAYGAAVEGRMRDAFSTTFGSISRFTRGMEHGDFPRMVQMTSALAFRAALSRALPALVEDRYMPMFAVHDELVVDSSSIGIDRIGDLVSLLESGASDRIGVPYRVGVSTGYTYAEAKAAH